ncbi:hypothetical protein DUNSADRAFT_16518 [Dunaliella salina]|uniref:Encoded protein n=1 Tax=Dunaliella salina TaxID=3046 RepID=A0ABQ7G3F6_DUNSA|nr:hypothetical protein DUNSADRAFT_16518 [Dunaliella salina]|eukprot:KAF5829133.1 hypothetical protein DUNSADRAFT_16518 [Dunaliella salina]
MQHLSDPSQGPWKGTIQVTPTGVTSESTFRESPGRISLGRLQGVETASSGRPGAGGEPPPAILNTGTNSFAGMYSRVSRPSHPDIPVVDSNPVVVGSLTASNPIQALATANSLLPTAAANSFGTARFVGG